MARDRAARPEAKPLRLFVAVDIPRDVRARLDIALEPLREAFPKARWAPPENWHVTVKFLGRTWPRLFGWVQEQVATAAGSHSPFKLALSELGSFPSARRARVLWVGLEDPTGGLAALAAGLDVALASEFEPEKRAFAAHLTVARSDPPIALGDELAGIEVPRLSFATGSLVLYRSHMQRPAPRYEPIAECPLGLALEGR